MSSICSNEFMPKPPNPNDKILKPAARSRHETHYLLRPPPVLELRSGARHARALNAALFEAFARFDDARQIGRRKAANFEKWIHACDKQNICVQAIAQTREHMLV